MMKRFMVLVAVALAKSDRKFTNKEDFMNSKTPSWWNDFSSEKRMNWIKNAPTGNVRLRSLFLDIAGDIDRIRTRCSKNNKNTIRVRRRTEEFNGRIENINDAVINEDSDPMNEKINILGRKLRGDIAGDIQHFISHQGRFIMEEIYRKGGNCEFIGVRLLTRLDRLNSYLYYNYCRQVNSKAPFCSWAYFNRDGSIKVHPRRNKWHQENFQRPIRN